MTGRNTAPSFAVTKPRGRTYELELSSAGGSKGSAGSLRSLDLSDKIVFKVAHGLTKPAISRAVEQLFHVKVRSVQVLPRGRPAKLSADALQFLRSIADAGPSSPHWLSGKSSTKMPAKAGPQPLLPLNVVQVLKEGS